MEQDARPFPLGWIASLSAHLVAAALFAFIVFAVYAIEPDEGAVLDLSSHRGPNPGKIIFRDGSWDLPSLQSAPDGALPQGQDWSIL